MLDQVRTDRVITSRETRLSERSFQSSSVATLTLELSVAALGIVVPGR
jgi:hypothetical protein